jgi:hypothetical protein
MQRNDVYVGIKKQKVIKERVISPSKRVDFLEGL